MPINRESRIENLWSSVTGATPDTGDFNYGEIALNVVDEKLYFKNSIGNLTVLSPNSGSPSSGPSGTPTYSTFTSFYSEPPGLTYPTLDNRNTIPVLDFDDTTNETTSFRGMIPHGATFTALLTRIFWNATNATAGTASWSVEYERTMDDVDSDNFSTKYTELSYFGNNASGVPIVLGITCSDVNGLGAGDQFRLRVTRNGATANDTLIGDAELMLIEVRGLT
jgi:hypothetical protein